SNDDAGVLPASFCVDGSQGHLLVTQLIWSRQSGLPTPPTRQRPPRQRLRSYELLGSYARRSTRHCLREDLVHLLPYLLTARWLQIPHSGLHVRMTEPLLYGAQIYTSP